MKNLDEEAWLAHLVEHFHDKDQLTDGTVTQYPSMTSRTATRRCLKSTSCIFRSSTRKLSSQNIDSYL